MKMRLGVTTDKILKHGNIETEGKSTIRAYIMKLKEQLVITDSEAMIL